MAPKDHADQTLDGRYRLIKLIGEGGMGSIYLGEHVVIGRNVAIKLLRVEFASSEKIVKRFFREAHAAAAIKHKNIIDIFDLGVAPWGEPYLVMEYLEGESLGSLLGRIGTISLAEACGILEPTLLALAAAHEAGIVHRDLKPENIFITFTESKLQVKLIDFGISKFIYEVGQNKLTQTGSLLGTPDFMSPEQARGQSDVNHLADIYAIGVILYESLTGVRPFAGSNYNELIQNILTQSPKEPVEIDPDFPAEANPIVMRALAKDRKERFQSALELLDAMKELSAFDKREKGLEQLTREVDELSFASGDLGADEDSLSDGIAGKVLDELVRVRTPHWWAWSAWRPGSKGIWFYLVLLGCAAVIAAGIYSSDLFSTKPKDDNPKQPLMAQPMNKAPKSNEDEGILITIEGIPEEGVIFYQDILVPMNPFRVDKKTTITPLRVEAEGYESFSVAVVPVKDKVIKIEMKKVDPKGKKSKTNRVGSTRSERTDPQVNRKPLYGGLTKKQEELAYYRNRSDLKNCHDEAIDFGEVSRTKTLRINMNLRVSAAGNVTDIRLSGRGAGNPLLDDCIENSVGRWVYPRCTKDSTVHYSFALKPQLRERKIK